MKPSHNFIFSASSTVTFVLHNDNSTPPQSKQIPDHSLPPPWEPVTVHLPHDAAAARIQAAYRSHRIRSLYRRISAVNVEADRVQALIQRQETVDAVRRDEREKLRMNEALMRLLLELDSVPGFDPTVREGRRKVSRRIVGLQEILDWIAEARVEDYGAGWCHRGIFSTSDWDEALEEMEERACRKRGGEEMERFCAEYLGFRCFQRFLRE